MWWKYYVLMYENGKLRLLKLFQEWEEGNKGERWKGEFKYDLL
jgi:hypothetical protein